MASLHRDERTSQPLLRRSRAARSAALGVVTLLGVLALGVTHAATVDDPPSDEYVIEVEAAPVAVGGEGVAVVRIKALDPYHWNKEYPARVTVEGTAFSNLSVAKREFKQLSGDFEVGETVATVRIPVGGKAAGQETLTVDLRFSVCTDKVCLIKRASTEIAVTVAP